MPETVTVQIPEFVVRHVGALQLQLAALQEENQRLVEENRRLSVTFNGADELEEVQS